MTVQVWQAYAEGINGLPPLRELEEKYAGTRKQKYYSTSQTMRSARSKY
jgi:hypothetical protein